MKPTALKNALLFLFCSIIWGSTWHVVGLQVNKMNPFAAVFHRFFLCAIGLFIFCKMSRKNLSFSLKQHSYFLFQGLFLFSLNFIFAYMAKALAQSGLVALSFSSLIYFNILGSWIFLNKKIGYQIILGSALGTIGLLFIFNQEFINFKSTSDTLTGLSLGVVSSFFGSVGTIITAKTLKPDISVSASNAWSMAYGGFFTFWMALFFEQDLNIPFEKEYISSLLYLVLLATMLSFEAYILLVKRIGPERAAYCNVASPVVTLGFSWILEDLQWSSSILAGVCLCLIGNIITLMPSKDLKNSKQENPSSTPDHQRNDKPSLAS